MPASVGRDVRGCHGGLRSGSEQAIDSFIAGKSLSGLWEACAMLNMNPGPRRCPVVRGDVAVGSGCVLAWVSPLAMELSPAPPLLRPGVK